MLSGRDEGDRIGRVRAFERNQFRARGPILEKLASSFGAEFIVPFRLLFRGELVSDGYFAKACRITRLFSLEWLMLSGFYAVYYTGSESSGNFSLLVRGSDVIGLEAGGGIIRGTCAPLPNGGAFLDLVFAFERGTELVTGQKLESDLIVPFQIEVKTETIAGQTQRAAFPTGPVNFRIDLLTRI